MRTFSAGFILAAMWTLGTADPAVAAATPCGDHNADCQVTATDALMVLRQAVGLPRTITCPADCQAPTTMSTTTTTLPGDGLDVRIDGRDWVGLDGLTVRAALACYDVCAIGIDCVLATASAVVENGAFDISFDGLVESGMLHEVDLFIDTDQDDTCDSCTSSPTEPGCHFEFSIDEAVVLTAAPGCPDSLRRCSKWLCHDTPCD